MQQFGDRKKIITAEELQSLVENFYNMSVKGVYNLGNLESF